MNKLDFREYKPDFYLSALKEHIARGKTRISVASIQEVISCSNKTATRTLLWLIEKKLVAKNSFDNEHAILKEYYGPLLPSTEGLRCTDKVFLYCVDLYNTIDKAGKGLSISELETMMNDIYPVFCLEDCTKGRDPKAPCTIESLIRQIMARLIHYGALVEKEKGLFDVESSVKGSLLYLITSIECDEMKEYVRDVLEIDVEEDEEDD